MKMMKTFVMTAGLSLMLSAAVRGQNKLEVEITELRSDQGPVMLELFDAQHQSIMRQSGVIKNGKATLVLSNLKPGRYAVRYYHDENNNQKLDTNLLGIPTEGYGFSNDAYGTFGPKSFDQWLVDVQHDTRIVLKTKN